MLSKRSRNKMALNPRALLLTAGVCSLGTGFARAVPFTTAMHRGPGGTPAADVLVNGRETQRFIVDLGAGITILRGAPPVAAQPAARFTGFRMTGERIDSTLYGGPSLALGPLNENRPLVGYWDGLDPSVAGMLPASFFAKTPVTFDYSSRTFVMEDNLSLAQRRASSSSVPLATDVYRNGATVAFVDVQLAEGVRGQCLLDTGQFNVQVNKRYMNALHRNIGDPDVVEQGDHVIAHLPRVSLAAAPSIDRRDMKVIFRDIIYDCVLGNAFWGDDTAFTLDLGRKQLYVRKSSRQTQDAGRQPLK